MYPNEKETVMSSDVQVAVAVEETKEPVRKLGFSGCDQTKVAIVTCELPINILVQRALAKRLTDEFCYRVEREKEQRSCQEMGE